MNQGDYDKFGELLGCVAELYGRTVKPVQTAMYFRALADFPLESIQAAFDAHAKCPERGRFWPLPADLLAQLERAAAIDGRPSPEEAWATAIQAQDEAATVVWTAETAQAWAEVGSALMQAGDRFNASRGFVSKYGELVAAARRAGRPVEWIACLGWDKELRHQALQAAVAANRISRQYAALVHPRHNLDTGPVVAAIAGRVMPMIASSRPAESGDRAAEIQRASDRLAALAEKLRQQEPARDMRHSSEMGRRIVMQAVEAGVLTSVREIDLWMTRAGNREDMSELQAAVLGGAA